MITKQKLLERLFMYISSQVDNLSQTNPLIGFTRPLIMKGLKKKLTKFADKLDDFAEDDGTFDVEGTLGEMVKSVSTIEPFTVNAPVVGAVKIGGGNIIFNIPLVDKGLVFDGKDIDELMRILTAK